MEDATRVEKHLTFIQNNGKESLTETDKKFDPLYSMIGFIMKCPKVSDKKRFTLISNRDKIILLK